MIPLVTSIPSLFSRRAADGSDVGRDYAHACIRSWRQSGFDPITVNAAREGRAQVIVDENVKQVLVDRDAEAEFGKPLVYLSDLIQAARGAADGPVAITNADIILDVPAGLRKQIENLEPGECIVQKRVDINDVDSRRGRRFEAGYDLFVYHAADLARFDGGPMVMGLPWWDHYLPIRMYLEGLRPMSVDQPFVFHLLHEDRWSGPQRARLAEKFIAEVEKLCEPGGFARAEIREYCEKVLNARDGVDLSFIDQIKIKVRGFTEQGRLRNARKAIGRVAGANVAWLDQQQGAR
ncbi:MAG: hypothetical protein ACT4OU_08155 [Hyphomicrobium sp.]